MTAIREAGRPARAMQRARAGKRPGGAGEAEAVVTNDPWRRPVGKVHGRPVFRARKDTPKRHRAIRAAEEPRADRATVGPGRT